jgi:predicted nucleic acid-binding protein
VIHPVHLDATLILLDANLLLYAYHPRDERHLTAKSWLE